MKGLRCCALFGAAITINRSASAQSDPTDHPPRPKPMQVSLGGGVMLAPKYEGSDEVTVRPLPLASVVIGGKVFLGAGMVGMYLVRKDGFTGTAGVALGLPRSPSHADALAGLDRRPLGAFSISAISYRAGPVDLGLAGTRSLGTRGGYAIQARTVVTVPMGGRLAVAMHGSVTFADRKNMAYDFGVSAVEAARRASLVARGDPRLRPGEARTYLAGAGLRSIGAGTMITLQITPRWGLMGVLEATRLGNSAAASPLVRRRFGVSSGIGATLTP